MEAVSDSEVLAVDAPMLGKCVSQNLVLYAIAAEYGWQYCKRVAEARPPHSRFPTDLDIPGVDYCDIVGCMSSELRVLIGPLWGAPGRQLRPSPQGDPAGRRPEVWSKDCSEAGA